MLSFIKGKHIRSKRTREEFDPYGEEDSTEQEYWGDRERYYAQYLSDMENEINRRNPPNPNWEQNPLYSTPTEHCDSLITTLGKGNMVVAGKTMAGKNVLIENQLKKAVFNDNMKWNKIYIISETAELNEDFDFMEEPGFLCHSGVRNRKNLVKITPNNSGELENYFEETKALLKEAKKRGGKKRLKREREKHKTLVIVNDSQGSLRMTNKEDLICRMATYLRQMDWMMIVMTQSTRAIGPTLLTNIGYFVLFGYNEAAIKRIEKELGITVSNKARAKQWLRTPKNSILLVNYWKHERNLPEKAILIPKIKREVKDSERVYK